MLAWAVGIANALQGRGLRSKSGRLESESWIEGLFVMGRQALVSSWLLGQNSNCEDVRPGRAKATGGHKILPKTARKVEMDALRN